MNVVKLISKASECNVNQFISCAFDEDLSVLIVSGNPSPKQLAEAWQNILIEFNDTAGYSASTEELVLARQIEIINARCHLMERTLFAYKELCGHTKIPLAALADYSIFEKYGYIITPTEDRKFFMQQLLAIEDSEKSYIIELEDLRDEMKRLTEKETETNPISSRRVFLKQIKNIELFYKYNIPFETYSVERLAILISDYRDMVDRSDESKN